MVLVTRRRMIEAHRGGSILCQTSSIVPKTTPLLYTNHVRKACTSATCTNLKANTIDSLSTDKRAQTTSVELQPASFCCCPWPAPRPSSYLDYLLPLHAWITAAPPPPTLPPRTRAQHKHRRPATASSFHFPRRHPPQARSATHEPGAPPARRPRRRRDSAYRLPCRTCSSGRAEERRQDAACEYAAWRGWDAGSG